MVGNEKIIWSEAHQVRIWEEPIATLKQIPFLAGRSPSILKDFRSPPRVLKDVQDSNNRTGLVSECGIRKAAFAVRHRELQG